MIRNLGQVAAIYIGSSQPTNTNLIWLDNTVVPYAFRAYDGSTWSELATRDWVKMFVDGWLVSLPPSTQAGDTDYLLINSNNVNYKITVKEFVKSAVGNPLDFKGVIRTDADFPNPANCEAGDMYVIITSPAGGTVTDPYSGQVFEDTEKIVWDEVTKSWASLGKIEINVDLSTDYSATNVTINSSAGKSTTIEAASTSLAGVMLPQQVKRLTYLSNGSTVPGDPSELDPDTPAHKHNYGDILDRLISQQETGDSTFHPMSQKATTDNLDLKFDKANVVQVQGASTVMVMSQKAVTDAITTLDEWIKNELTKYLPLSGGDMTGDITLGNSVYILGDNTSGRSLRIAGVNANNQVVIGSLEAPTYILSNSSDLIHSRNNVSYKILDSYNLPDPATLSGDNTWTGTNTFNGITNINNSFVLANSKALQGRNVAGTLNYAIGQVNANNNVEVGDTRVPLMLVSNDSNLIHYRGTTTYGIWDAYNLPDPAAKSADNVFTGTNSFTAGKFNVGPFNVTATGSLLIDMVNTGGWERSIMWSNNSAPASRIRFGSYGNDNVAEYAWIGIGDVEYNTAQYRFYNTSMRVPSVWSLDDAGGNSFIQSQSTQLINFGRSAGTTKIRSGVTDLIHTKETTDYTIWDASNLSDPVTKSGDNTFTGNNTFTAGKFNVGVFSINNLSSLTVDVGANAGAWSRHLKFMADSSATGAAYGAYSSSDGSINYAWIGVEDTGYSNAQYKFYPDKLYVPSKWELTDKGTDTSLILYSNAESQHLGRAIGVTYIRSGDDDLYHTKDSTNYKILDESNWKRVMTTDEMVAKLSIDSNGYPSIMNLDGTNYNWIRTSSEGILPNTAITLVNGGASALGTSGWAFKNGYIANVYANKYSFGSSGVYFRLDGDNKIALTSASAARGMEVGNLLVSSNYSADASKVPINGIFASGRIQSNDSMLVGYSGNVTEGMLGYGLYYDGTFAQGLGSEYSSGALVLYKMLNPNKGKAGYNVPRAATGTPTYLKIANGTVKLGVGVNKTYTPGEEVTVTEHTLATLDAVNTKLNGYLPLTGGTMTGKITMNIPTQVPIVFNYTASGGTDCYVQFRITGVAKGAVGFLNSNGTYLYNYTTSKYLFVGNDGAYFGTDSSNTKLLTSVDLAGYLPLTGGTLTGILRINSGGSEPLIINNSASAGEAYVVTKTQGTTRGVMGWNSSLGMFLQDSRGFTFSMKADGVYFGASSSTLIKLPTSTDLSGYLPLAGGTMTGSIIMNNNVVIQTKDASGNLRRLIGKGTDNVTYIGDDASYLDLHGSKIIHVKNGIAYGMWDENNLPNPVQSTSTKKVTDIQVVNALPTTQASGVLYLVVK